MLEHLKDELDTFRKRVIQQAKSNLTRTGKNASKRLYNSLDSDLKGSANSFQLDFMMADYGEFQDKGVSGIKKKYDTPYSYKSKMPPPSKLDKWIVRRGLAPRDKNGKLMNRKSLQFVVARSIYRKGFKPSLFFTKPFENEYKKLSKDLIEAYGLDMSEFLQYTLTNYKK
jgi:hypothetical protein